ncbi:MAG: hypothetical protein CBC24_09810 [Candidatus Pelagibacter sp. TMED64]|nr:hypothetical protein [Candidatus Pelagibacter sp.]OUU62745.1 MAG: hypothetical protein CBC24_09810 [Candidatus Pelagibacter sp. TMED64]
MKIRLIEDNDTLDAIRLMKEYVTINGEFHGFEYNEAVWMRYFLDIVEYQKTNPHYLAIGCYNEHNIQGFLTAHAYVNYYNNKYIMDVKDCIVNLENKNNAYVVYKLFDAMIEHTKKHGGKHWRADSVRGESDSLRYGKLLAKRYNAKLSTSIRGIIGE